MQNKENKKTHFIKAKLESESKLESDIELKLTPEIESDIE